MFFDTFFSQFFLVWASEIETKIEIYTSRVRGASANGRAGGLLYSKGVVIRSPSLSKGTLMILYYIENHI